MIAAFKSLCTLTAKLPFRVLWDPSKDLRIHTDASCDGLGFVLKQKEEEETWSTGFPQSHVASQQEELAHTPGNNGFRGSSQEMETLPLRPPHHGTDRFEICRANQYTDGHSQQTLTLVEDFHRIQRLV
jgi:hypothetical protein